MKKLLVFCGTIGCGKTTLIEKIIKKPRRDFIFIDVYNYIKKYQNSSGRIKPEKTLKAYQEMYEDLGEINTDTILELGTNHAEFNIRNLNALIKKFSILIFFCLLDPKICARRTLTRPRPVTKKDLEERLKRIFPGNHIKLAKKFGLKYRKLDMCLTQKQKIKIVNKILKQI